MNNNHRQTRQFTALIALIGALLATGACQKAGTDKAKALRVGAMDGPEAELVETAADVAKARGLAVEVIRFSDYIAPNVALAEGSLDLNAFQHQPYLDETKRARGYALVPVAKTFLYPMGVYSKSFKTLSELPEEAKIAIPNDPSNEGRALLMFAKAGLITLKTSAGILATPADIESNPKRLQFTPIDAAQTVRALEDVAAAAINTNYAVAAGLRPLRDAIFIESKDSPYMNLIVARDNHASDPRIKVFIQAYQSPEVLRQAVTLFEGASVAGWESKI